MMMTTIRRVGMGLLLLGSFVHSPLGFHALAAEKQAGQNGFVFRYLAEESALPEEVLDNLPHAHGGFAVDPRTGEVFFGLKGAGILYMSNDLKVKEVMPVTEAALLEGNFHNTTLFYNEKGERFLALPDNEKNRVYLVTDGGRLVATLSSPQEINAYYRAGGGFNPTDTEYADGHLYVADGYSAGNYVAVADPWRAVWTSRYFGGRTTAALEYGLFGTAHGITLNPATRRLEVSDRAHARIQSFDFQGTYLGTTRLPEGSLPCDVDFHHGYALVGCLKGPGGQTPAPFYVLNQDGQILSEVNPKNDFGLDLFTHLHNATWKVVRGQDGREEKLWALVTAWNPGGFAVFEVVR